jgi:hypothetical protein
MKKLQLLFFLISGIFFVVHGQTKSPDGFVRYSDFGAKGDGKTDDIEAIVAAHAFANEKGLPVKADEGATYYIGGKNRTAVIRTNTDFGTAAFVIDDIFTKNESEEN